MFQIKRNIIRLCMFSREIRKNDERKQKINFYDLQRQGRLTITRAR